jgi:hypothetical protein
MTLSRTLAAFAISAAALIARAETPPDAAHCSDAAGACHCSGDAKESCTCGAGKCSHDGGKCECTGCDAAKADGAKADGAKKGCSCGAHQHPKKT